MSYSRRTLQRLRRASIVLLVVALSACGGGRGNSLAGVEQEGIEPVSGSPAGATAGGVTAGSASTSSAMSGASAPVAASPFGSLAFDIGGMPFAMNACAEEGGKCVFTGEQTVAYGAEGKYIVKRVVNGVDCTNEKFGDSIVGVAKHCFLGLTVTIAGAGSTVPAASAPASVPVAVPTAPTVPPMAPATTVAGTTVPTTVPTAAASFDANTKPTKVEAARFLVQSTFGPSMSEIDRLSTMSYAAWMDQQFATAPMDSYWNYVHRAGPMGCNPCTSGNVNAVMEAFWMQAVRGQDQLRQRTVLALSEIFVISAVNSGIESVPTAHAGYFDMLSNNAFGNFRTLLEQVATHPSMGIYLSHMQNEKEDPATGRLPDENFAREVLQLFTVGLWQLNDDGSRKKDAAGNDIPTYSQSDIMGMAKVFTGMSWGNGDWTSGWSNANPKDPYERVFNQPMIYYPTHHSSAEKRILQGVVIPAGTPGPQSLKVALDTLFNHPNVGPFIGGQLIRRMVTSNPSPSYVRRVSAAFANNGSGVRGDMKAVMRAVLLDPEARDIAKLADPTWGKLREPMIRYANFMRAFDVKATSGLYKIWNLEDTMSSVGQNPMRAPSVFNWFRPDYAPPGAVANQSLVAPEFQITHETTTTGYANFMQGVAERQSTWFRDNVMAKYGPTSDYLAGDYSVEMALSRTDAAALVDRLNLLLVAGQMTPATRKTIIDAVNATPVDGDIPRRVPFAIFLVTQSPEFIVQK